MKKFLVGIVTLVAAVMLSSPAFGALSTDGWPADGVGTFYFDVGVTVIDSREITVNPDPDGVIEQMQGFGWQTDYLNNEPITFYKKFDGPAEFENEPYDGSVEFDQPVRIFVGKWGQGPNNPDDITSWAFLLSSQGTYEAAWDLDIDPIDVGGMSHAEGYAAVPIPAAVWLLGSGVLGLVAVRRRRS